MINIIGRSCVIIQVGVVLRRTERRARYSVVDIDLILCNIDEHRPVPPLLTCPNSPQIGTQDPIFGVQSVELKDAYTDDMFSLFSLWDSNKEKINLFIKQPNKFPS